MYPNRKQVWYINECTFVLLNSHISVTTIALVEQDAELGQMCQAVDQLRQDKAKETERADKLASDLKGEFLLVGITVEVASLYNGSF